MNSLRRLENHSQMVLMRRKPGAVVGSRRLANQDTRMIWMVAIRLFTTSMTTGSSHSCSLHTQRSITLLRHHYDVLLIDATYKTNRYNMPLVHTTGRTNQSKSFDIGFAFVKAEKTQNYSVVEWCLRGLYSDHVGGDPALHRCDCKADRAGRII
jgi:hypothetical protein